MFEFFIALKYLIPRKKHLSVTLIAMMSVGVISLIVWLLLVFLSVTSGIEASWLKKLTELNAPIRISPTSAYFSSYYHKIDAFSSASNFSLKTLGEKQDCLVNDPYDPEEDPELPSHFPKPLSRKNGAFLNPVTGLVQALSDLKTQHPDLFYQDYEMSGALLKLQLLRKQSSSPFSPGQETVNFLTQASYLATPPLQEKTLSSLLVPFSQKDINHLLFLANYRMEKVLEDGAPSISSNREIFQERLKQILPFLHIHTVKTVVPQWKLPGLFLPEGKNFRIYGQLNDNSWELSISSGTRKNSNGVLTRKGNTLFVSFDKNSLQLDATSRLSLEEPIIFKSTIQESSLEDAENIQMVKLLLQANLQGHLIEGISPWKDLVVESFTPVFDQIKGKSPPWIYTTDSKWKLPLGPQGELGILLPKGFKDNGALLGDRGFVSYQGSTSSSVQEQRIPIFVAGFYDPGIISIGNKCLLVPKNLTRTINSSNTPYSFDKISLGGFQVWIDSPKQAKLIKQKLIDLLSKEEVLPFWTVSSYEDYDFAKDLLQQFQSDRLLLSLIGIIILIVACCNIISFLILLVSDKKKEIAILQAMGASTQSIAYIFGICGLTVGVLGCAFGTIGAIFTLHHIDSFAQILSALQGHDAFNPAFYGSSLPNQLSSEALLFIVIITPILSILSALIPALKACKLSPSAILRSES